MCELVLEDSPRPFGAATLTVSARTAGRLFDATSTAHARMPRKQPFPPEADTQPDIQRPSGPAPKSKRGRADAPTSPPPKGKRAKADAGESAATEARNSGIRSRKPPSTKRDPTKRDPSGAAVDEVTADLSRDPRRERDDD